MTTASNTPTPIATKIVRNKAGRLVITTPPVTLLRPALTKADDGSSGGFQKDPEFAVSFTFSPDDPELAIIKDALRTVIQEAYVVAKQKTGKASYSKNSPFKVLDDGRVQFKAKLNQYGTNRATRETFEQAPALFDENAKPWDAEARGYIAHQSEGRVCFEVTTYNTQLAGGVGASLRLKAVQVTKQTDNAPSTTQSSAFGFGGGSNTATNTGATQQAAGADDFDEDDIPF